MTFFLPSNGLRLVTFLIRDIGQFIAILVQKGSLRIYRRSESKVKEDLFATEKATKVVETRAISFNNLGQAALVD